MQAESLGQCHIPKLRRSVRQFFEDGEDPVDYAHVVIRVFLAGCRFHYMKLP
jgi:hypothetical protein